MTNSLDDFISATDKSQVAIIVPLFGYWNDVKKNELLEEHVLSIVMNRVYSRVHNYILVFVANPETVENKANDPECVANVIHSRSKANNVRTLPVKRKATYGEYIQTGMDFVMNETKAQFVVLFNPWVMLQDGAIDAIVDRCNRGDEAKIVCGRDYRDRVQAAEFDSFQDPRLGEEWDVTTDLMAFPRFLYELSPIDTQYKTHSFMAQDFAHAAKRNGYASINYPQAGIFPFNFPWNTYESKKDKEADKAHFTEKWGFSIEG